MCTIWEVVAGELDIITLLVANVVRTRACVGCLILHLCCERCEWRASLEAWGASYRWFVCVHCLRWSATCSSMLVFTFFYIRFGTVLYCLKPKYCLQVLLLASNVWNIFRVSRFFTQTHLWRFQTTLVWEKCEKGFKNITRIRIIYPCIKCSIVKIPNRIDVSGTFHGHILTL